MARDYDDFSSLLKDLENDITEIAKGSMNKKVKEIYKTKAEQSYREYTPKTNRSRFRNGLSGSFADEENFKEEVAKDKDGIAYTLVNHRETDCDCEYCKTHKPVRIDMYIEQGVAGKSKIKEKLVYEKSQNTVDEVIEDFLEGELTKKGW